MIYNFLKFNEEYSKNDPIPEIQRFDRKLGIILLGAPGSGKSTFSKNFILTKNQNFKIFSTDDLSLLYTKDAKKYHVGSSELNILKLGKFIETGQNFIYDTTGASDKNVFNVCKSAENNGYKVIFIQILIDIESSKMQNRKRGLDGGHTADDDYIDFVYSRQFKNMSDYSSLLKPHNFYIVLNKSGKYRFMKYENGKLLKRKVDKYIPLKN